MDSRVFKTLAIFKKPHFVLLGFSEDIKSCITPYALSSHPNNYRVWIGVNSAIKDQVLTVFEEK